MQTSLVFQPFFDHQVENPYDHAIENLTKIGSLNHLQPSPPFKKLVWLSEGKIELETACGLIRTVRNVFSSHSSREFNNLPHYISYLCQTFQKETLSASKCRGLQSALKEATQGLKILDDLYATENKAEYCREIALCQIKMHTLSQNLAKRSKSRYDLGVHQYILTQAEWLLEHFMLNKGRDKTLTKSSICIELAKHLIIEKEDCESFLWENPKKALSLFEEKKATFRAIRQFFTLIDFKDHSLKAKYLAFMVLFLLLEENSNKHLKRLEKLNKLLLHLRGVRKDRIDIEDVKQIIYKLNLPFKIYS